MTVQRCAGVPAMLAAVLLPALAFAQDRRTEYFTITLDDGRELSVQLSAPSAQDGPLPALMLFGGFRRGGEVLDLVVRNRPMIWANFDYPYEPPRKFRFPSSLRHAPQMRAAIHGTFEGVEKLHAALAARPDIDARRITVVGASAGAPFATVSGSRAQIPGVILVQGFAQVPQVIQHLIERKHRAKYGDWVRWPAKWLARFIHWYCEIPDIAGPARRFTANQKVLLVTAEDDELVPRPASDAIWAAIRQSPARATRMIQPGGHLRGKEGEVEKILVPALAWMEEEGLL